nr:NIa protein [Tomato necrotic stunt virus]
SKSLMKGPMDFNPIAKNICRITNDSDGIPISTYGIGFGGYMIANQHFFKRNNGLITFKTHHGVFKAPNSTVLKIFPIKGRDLVVVELPKDFPVFSNKIHFRSPKDKERVCMVSSIFQEKSVTSTVSESSPIFPVAESGFYKHWISTDDGSCGLPLVSVVDGKIVGIHSLANNYVNENYFTAFEPHFETNVLRSPEALEWIKHWKYNPENISWGYLSLNDSAPSGLFKTTKLVTDLVEDEQNSVRWQ